MNTDFQTDITTRVEQIMTNDVIVLSPNDPLAKAKEVMESHNIHHLPVVDSDNNLLGILSNVEINTIKDWTDKFKNNGFEKSHRLFGSLLAKDVMIKDVYFIDPKMSLYRIATIFNENAFHCLPVVEDGKLKGIVTPLDLIRYAYLTGK